MRLEATIPDSRAQELLVLVKQLGLTRSQIVDEALSLFLKAIVETRRGRRLMTVDPMQQENSCELMTPTLAAIERASKPIELNLSTAEIENLRKHLATEPAQGKALKAAAQRHEKSPRPTFDDLLALQVKVSGSLSPEAMTDVVAEAICESFDRSVGERHAGP